jgi:hypothetical protein
MTRQGFFITSQRTARRPGIGRAAAVWLVLLVVTVVGACARGPQAPAADSPTAEVVRLQQTTALLERQLDLAGGKEFHLVLDPVAPDLALMLRGAELQRFPVLGLQVGSPRVFWASRRKPQAWQGVIWARGELDPPRPTDRIVITAEAPGKGEQEPEPPPIPPTAEELYRVPPRFHIRFSGGLSVEIRPREADANAGCFARLRAWWSTKWGDVAAALGLGDRDLVRLRVVLKPKDAESLYRSLPPSVRLLVLSGSPAAAVGQGNKVPGTISPAAPSTR